MPKISIIMPLYNSVDYLKEAIESIIQQTYTDWEFIIINEFGSEDGSREVVESYAKIDHRIKLIQNTARLRIAASMNAGIEVATGEYIARMDADDISLPDRFAKQVQFLDEHPEIVMCGVKVEIFGSNAFEWKLETDTDRLTTNILFYSPSVHPTVMIRKSFLDQYGIRYNKDYRASEDYDIFARICEHGKIANIDEVLFRYRIMENNATFKNNDIGLVIYSEVMQRQFERMGLTFTKEEIQLLSPHYSVKGAKGKQVCQKLIQLDLLLKRILVANAKTGLYDQDDLMCTLHKRYQETYDSIAWACSDVDYQKTEQLYQCSIFRKDSFYHPDKKLNIKQKPKVSVLIPTFKSEKYLLDTLWSILEQSFEDYEILVLNEFGSDDDTVFIAGMMKDPRIKVIQNKTKLGLGDSLNLGIREANGEYLARVDADDLSHKDRFKLQVEFLDENPEYGIVGSWQHHFGLNTEWIHKCHVINEDIEAEMIYNCDLCHSTLMLRKSALVDNNLFYDNSYAAEDYELWTRAIKTFKIGNIPQVLGEYRVGEDNITAKKMDLLSKESGELAARNIKYYFGIDVPEQHVRFLSGWRNEFASLSKKQRERELKVEEKLLKDMWKVNQKSQRLAERSLLQTMNKRWRNINNTWQEDGIVYEIDELFKYVKYESIVKDKMKSVRGKLTPKRFIKRILHRFYLPIKYRTVDIIQKQLWDLDGHLGDVDGHLYDYKEEVKREVKKEISGLIQKQQAELMKQINNVFDVQRMTMEKYCNNTFALQQKQYEKAFGELKDEVVEQVRGLIKQERQLQIMLEKQEVITKSIADGLNANEGLVQELTHDLDIKYQKLQQSFNEIMTEKENYIIQTLDTRIWKSELLITKDVNSKIWNLQRKIVRNREDKELTNDIYNDDFYEDNQYGSYISAKHILKKIIPVVHPKSIIDFGCGTGTWLAAAKGFKDVTDIYGVDGDYVNRDMLMIPQDRFEGKDLRQKIDLKKHFDLAMSLEVAEHIEEQYADNFIDSICNHADVVLFSAAHVGQGGDYHVNEQPIEYWVGKFEHRGYRQIDIRDQFKETWYRENISLYVKNDVYSQFEKLFVK